MGVRGNLFKFSILSYERVSLVKLHFGFSLLFWMALLVPAALVPAALVPTALVPMALVPAALAVDECGGSSALTNRYSAHSSSPSTPYAEGTIVTTGTGGSLQLWQWTSSVTSTTAPTTLTPRGWRDVTNQYALRQVLCDSSDSLSSSTNIQYTLDNTAVVYDRTGTVNTITHLGATGEIHILSGGVSRADDNSDSGSDREGRRAAVRLVNNTSQTPLRFSLASGASVSNLDTSNFSYGVYVKGGGHVFLDIAGDSSAIYAEAGGAGNVDIDITGGTQQSTDEDIAIVSGFIENLGTGGVDIDISGASTVLYGGSGSAAVVITRGRRGIDRVKIGSGVSVCRGTYATTCTPGSGDAIVMSKLASTGSQQAGSITFINAGRVWGGVWISAASTIASTVTNQAGGSIDGAFTGGAGSSTVSNQGTWTLTGSSNFGGGTDSFTNTGTGTFIIYHAGTSLAMSNLESFTLHEAAAGESGGILRFSLASGSLPTTALLNIGSISPTLAGIIDVVTRSGSLPTSGSLPLITTSGRFQGTDLRRLSLAAGLSGYLSVTRSNNLVLNFTSPICGGTTARTITSPGHAHKEILCNHQDSLLSTSNINVRNNRVAIRYAGTQSNGTGTVRSISNTGTGGEIHIESGGVLRPDDGTDFVPASERIAVQLVISGLFPQRFVMASDTSVANQDTTANSHAVFVRGDGHVSLEIAGSTSATNGYAIYGRSGGGTVDLDISGGTQRSSADSVVRVLIAGGPGIADVAIMGTGSPVLHGGTTSTTAAVLHVTGGARADRIQIGSGAVVCRGIYATTCTSGSGNAIYFGKSLFSYTGGVLRQGGSVTITNAGRVWGDIRLNSVVNPELTSTVTNQAGGIIDGAFIGIGGSDAVTNAGTWTMRNNFAFGTRSDRENELDSFTNTGTFIVHRGTATLGMDNLEALILDVEGTIRFSLPSATLPSNALLNIGGAGFTLAGNIDIVTRTGSLPTTGSLTLFTGTVLSGTALNRFSLPVGVSGRLSISGNNLVLTLAPHVCGATTTRTVTSPGHANKELLCNHQDTLTTASNIDVQDGRVALRYGGTQSNGTGTVNSITNTGFGGEIHIESGAVSRQDDNSDSTTGNRAAVRLINSAPESLRLVVASGTSISNADTSSNSHAITVQGGGNVSMEIAASSTSATSGFAIHGTSTGGTVDLDISGGTHTGSTDTVNVSAAARTGIADVAITGASAVLHGGSTSTTGGVINVAGGGGTDKIQIGSGVVVCRGAYATTCTPGTGNAIYFTKNLVETTSTPLLTLLQQQGSVTITNAGRVWGDITVSGMLRAQLTSTITNQASGSIDGAFTGMAGTDTVSNAGTWTMRSNFNFGGSTDSFTNTGTGTFIVHHAGTTLAMNNLETFILQAASVGESGGILRFSLASGSLPSGALLNIAGATPSLAGVIDITTRTGSLPASWQIILLTGTGLTSSTNIAGLSLAAGLGGKFSISGNNLLLTRADPTCGTATTRTVTPPGHANMQVVCNHNDYLFVTTNVARTDARLAIIYRGTQSGGSGTVNSISNTGSGGEIHIESGGVSRADDSSDSTTANARSAVTLRNSGTNPLRLVVASGTSISNADTSSQSHAIRVEGGGAVSLAISGSTSATAGRAILAVAGGSGNLDLDISGGTHTGSGSVVSASLASAGTGALDIDLTGSSTVLHGGGATAAVLSASGIGGADDITIGSGVVVCRGSYAASACTAGGGTAISLAKSGTQAGSGRIRNSGRIWGGLSVSTLTVASTITNQAGGSIDGAFTGGAGSSTVSNAGTWTMRSAFDFGNPNTGNDADSFTNTGTFIVRYAGATLAMNNLETFGLQASGTLRFSLASAALPATALLNIGGATPTLAGIIAVITRDSSTLPTSGQLTLITGTSLSSSTDLSGLSLASGITGVLGISGNNLILAFVGAADVPTIATCGTATTRTVTLPGHANMQVICNHNDSLSTTTNIVRTDSRLAIRYQGTQSGGAGAVNSISNTGSGGEIHIESGSVSRADDGLSLIPAHGAAAVRLINSGTDALRLVVASSTSVANADTTAQSHAIHVEGGGEISLEIAGSTSATGGRAIFARAGGSGDVDLDISGGTHTSGGSVVSASLAAAGTGKIDIDITGSSTVVHGGSFSAAVVRGSGIGGADEITIGSSVVVCRGSYLPRSSLSSGCAAGSGIAISLEKTGTQAGSGSITNSGSIWGGISVSTLTRASTITNNSGGSIDGAFTGGSANSTVSNQGTWTMRDNFDFGGGSDSDSFTNTGTGTLIVRHSGTTLAMNNLETFTLQAAGAGESGGILRFSLGRAFVSLTPLLNIGGATPTLAGEIAIVTRDSSSLPTSGSLTLITGTSLSSSTSIASLTLASGISGSLAISGNNLVLTFSTSVSVPVTSDVDCGTAVTRTVTAPGHANMQVVCDHNDSLSTTNNIVRTDSRLAIIYRGTQSNGTGAVNSISNTGSGGEIHIESGSVSRADDGSDTTAANARSAVTLRHSGTNPLRLVVAASTSISNVDTSSQSHAIRVEGGAAVSLSIAGSTSAIAGRAIRAVAGGSGNVDLDISAGTHTGSGSVVSASLAAAGTGAIDIDITGSSTVLHGGSATAALVSASGIAGADDITIGSGVMLCRGSYSASTCTSESGDAISLAKSGTQGGSGSITNSGSIWGDLSVSTLTTASTITNRAGGSIDGAFTGGPGSSTVSNQGTWTMRSAFDFGNPNTGNDADSFTNTGTGTFIVHYDGATLNMNNLETFTLQAAGAGESGGIVRFSLASGALPGNALMNIGGAAPTLAGMISIVTRDSSTLPTSGQITLITGTSLSGTDISGLSLAAGISGVLGLSSGVLGISGNDLVLALLRPTVVPVLAACGTATTRTVTPPGHANMQVVCDHNDSLSTRSNIIRTDARLAILYRGTQNTGSGAVHSISNTGSGGEIHIESGSVSRVDDGLNLIPAHGKAAVRLMNSSTNPLRLVVASGTSISNADTSSQSHAIRVEGGGEVSLAISGSTSATAGSAIFAVAGGSGDVDLDISAGMHTGSASVVSASLASAGTGKVDIDITGSTTVLHGSSATAAVVSASGIGGADEMTIGSGVVVCRGSYAASACTAGTGTALSLAKSGTQAGTGSITNTGRIWGGLSVSTLTVASTITNNSGGSIDGAFTGGAGSSTVSNAGTWTMRSAFDFGGGSDSFTNSGTFIVRHAGTTLAMNNLETFRLQASGTLRFSLEGGATPATALLNIGGATPTFAGAIDIITRDSSALPTSGQITLITGTSLSSVAITSLTRAAGVSGEFSISGNNLIFTFTDPICGPSTVRTPVLPGHANKQVVCNHEDGLTNASDILIEDDRLAILYRGTQSNGSGSVRSIKNTGSGGEIHIETGSVRRVDDTSDSTTANERSAVILLNSGTNPLRLVVASGTSVSNLDTTSGSHGVQVSGGGQVSLTIAGATSATGGSAVFAQAGGSGDVDLDIGGGTTHTSSVSVVSASLASSGTGKIDIDITGASTVLHGGSNTAPVLSASGIAGADEIMIGSGVVVCRGSYAAGACTAGSGVALSLAKSGTQGGSGSILTAGSVWGGISVSSLTVASTITNQAGGSIDGAFTGGAGSSTVSNAGTWTMRSDFDFSGGSDSFTNTGTGTFIVHYDGTTLAMNNLETFTLQAATVTGSGGILRFSLASGALPGNALLNIGGAAPTLAGVISIVTRDSSTLPTSGTTTLITGTSLSGADVSSLSLAANLSGLLSISGNNLIVSWRSPAVVTPRADTNDCGTAVARNPVVLPGHANMQVVCDHNDSLANTFNVSRAGSRLAILYRGTQSDGSGTVNSISHTGPGGEIHIESGGVSRVDDGLDATTANERAAVRLINSDTNPLRLVTASGTAVSNADTTSGSHAIHVEGGGNVFVEVAGSTSAVSGSAVFAQASGSGDVDLDISGGTHTSSGNVVSASLGSGGAGAIDIDITGSSTVVHGGSALVAVVSASGIAGADEMTIGSGVVVCRGSYAANACTGGSGPAISLTKSGTQAGSGRIRNSGRVWGGISVSTMTVGTTIENLSGGSIDGVFTGGRGNDVVSNAGTWTMRDNFDFGSTTDSDSFTNTGTFIIRHAGTTLAMNNLESFTLQSSGTVYFSVARGTVSSTVLDIGGATPTLAGRIDVIPRSGSLPTSGSLTLITGTSLSGTDITSLSLADRIAGRLALSGNNLIISFSGVSQPPVTNPLPPGPDPGPVGPGPAGPGPDLPDMPDVMEEDPGTLSSMRGMVHTYDSVIQVSLFAAHAILNSMAASECAVKISFSQRSSHIRFERENCTWMNLGARRTTHERTTQGANDTEEIVANISGGVQVPLGDSGWGFSATAAYEYSDMDVGQASSEGHRLLGGLILSSMADGEQWNWRFAATGQVGRYEVERFAAPTTLGGGRSTAKPEVITVALHGGMEFVFSRAWESLGSWSVVPRLELDVTGVWMGKFTEAGSRFQLGETREILVSGTPSVEVRHAGETPWGLVQSWLDVGVVSFATDTKINYQISRGSPPRTIESTLERFFLDASVGMNLVRKGGAEFSFFLDGLLGYDTLIGGVTLKAKYAF